MSIPFRNFCSVFEKSFSLFIAPQDFVSGGELTPLSTQALLESDCQKPPWGVRITKNPIRLLAIPNRIFLYNCFAFRKEYPHLPLLFQPFPQIVARSQLPTFCRANRESFGFRSYANNYNTTARNCIHSLISALT